MPNDDDNTDIQQPAKPTAAEVVDAWFYSEFSDTAVSRDTNLWNLVFAAKDRLKEKLATQ